MRWIPVSERLPKDNHEVLTVVDSSSGADVPWVLYRRDGIWLSHQLVGGNFFPPTHWQPLPPAPGSEPCCGRCRHWRQITDDDELSLCEMIECIVPGATWHCADFEPKGDDK